MNNTDLETATNDKFVFYHIKFTILLTLQIAAIILSFLILIYFIKHRTLLKAQQNHGLLVLLVVNSVQLVFDLPFSLSFYSHGYVSPSVPSYCIFWTFFEYIIYAVSEYLLAIISIQRHIFIFHQHILRNRWKCHLLHNLPLALCVIYPTIFYVFAILLYPCDNTQWDYSSRVCGFANCYLMYGSVLGTFDLVVNNSMPVLLDILANVFMIVRVIAQKRRARQSMRSGQQRRMVMQLLCLSGLYLVGWAPFLLVEIINVVSDPNFLRTVEVDYFSDLIYIVYLFLPWMWLGFFPEVTKWILQLFHRRQAHTAVATIQTRNVTRGVQAGHLETAMQIRNTLRSTRAAHLETKNMNH